MSKSKNRKIQIKSITGELLFIHKADNNTVKKTVERAVRENVDLRNADLRDAYLRDADLRYAYLQHTNLKNTDLKRLIVV